jgi:hypothetical protein
MTILTSKLLSVEFTLVQTPERCLQHIRAFEVCFFLAFFSFVALYDDRNMTLWISAFVFFAVTLLLNDKRF